MRDAEEVAREIVRAKTGPAVDRILTEWQAEVRAATLAEFETEAAQRDARAYGDGYDAGLRARGRRVP